MSETRIIYGIPAETAGCPSPTEIINSALSAGSCYIIRTAPDTVQAQARVAELEARIAVLEAVLRDIFILAPTKTRYELAKMAANALDGEVQK